MKRVDNSSWFWAFLAFPARRRRLVGGLASLLALLVSSQPVVGQGEGPFRILCSPPLRNNECKSVATSFEKEVSRGFGYDVAYLYFGELDALAALSGRVPFDVWIGGSRDLHEAARAKRRLTNSKSISLRLYATQPFLNISVGMTTNIRNPKIAYFFLEWLDGASRSSRVIGE